jgi:hypothetical protein
MPAEFYLRFRTDDGTGRLWLRRGLFALAWRRAKLQETASAFGSAAEAMAFAEQFQLAEDVEVVSVSTEALRRG